MPEGISPIPAHQGEGWASTGTMLPLPGAPFTPGFMRHSPVGSLTKKPLYILLK